MEILIEEIEKKLKEIGIQDGKLKDLTYYNSQGYVIYESEFDQNLPELIPCSFSLIMYKKGFNFSVKGSLERKITIVIENVEVWEDNIDKSVR